MKAHLIWTMICAVTLTSLCFAQTGKQTPAIKPSATPAAEARKAGTQKELVAIEKRELEIIKNKNWKAFDTLLSETFVWVDDNGVVSGKRDTINYISGFDISDASMEDVMLTMFSSDVGVLTYKMTLKGSFRGEVLPARPSYVSSEYVRHGGKWVNVFNQTTLAK